MGWLANQISEIERDRALQYFGLALALANVLTFAYWQFWRPVVEILAADAIPICWPFFSNCHAIRGLSQSALYVLLYGYLAASLAAVAAFTNPRYVKVGYWILFALLFYRGFFLFQDYRLRLNQHYMLYWSMVAFLFVPGKRVAIRYLVILFYFWAGILKLTPEWISGAALYGEALFLVPQSLTPAACLYVIILELVLVFGLLSRPPPVVLGHAGPTGTVPPDFVEHRRLLLSVTDGLSVEYLRSRTILRAVATAVAGSTRRAQPRFPQPWPRRGTGRVAGRLLRATNSPVRLPGRRGRHRGGAHLRTAHVRTPHYSAKRWLGTRTQTGHARLSRCAHLTFLPESSVTRYCFGTSAATPAAPGVPTPTS